MSPCFTEVKSGLSPVASTSIWYDVSDIIQNNDRRTSGDGGEGGGVGGQ